MHYKYQYPQHFCWVSFERWAIVTLIIRELINFTLGSINWEINRKSSIPCRFLERIFYTLIILIPNGRTTLNLNVKNVKNKCQNGNLRKICLAFVSKRNNQIKYLVYTNSVFYNYENCVVKRITSKNLETFGSSE